MSPILVRPVREQLEHDRLIRLLQAKFKRKFDVGINPGAEQNAPVGNPPSVVFPDLALFSLERSRRLEGVIEQRCVRRTRAQLSCLRQQALVNGCAHSHAYHATSVAHVCHLNSRGNSGRKPAAIFRN